MELSDEKMGAYLDSASKFIALQQQHRLSTREESKTHLEGLMLAHILSLGALNGALLRTNGIEGETSDSISLILTLGATFVQGIDLCETAICEGCYFQAAALLRQGLETISAIEETKANQRKKGKVPNVKHAPWGLNQLYGNLSAAAHVADQDMLHELVRSEAAHRIEKKHAVSLVPEFRASVAWRLYGFHIALIIIYGEILHELYQEMYGEGLTEDEMEGFGMAQRVLLAEGWLKELKE